MDEILGKFFRKYEQAANALDFERMADFFAEEFISAGPKGTIARSRSEFLEKAEQAAGFYRSVGQKSMKILSTDKTPITLEYTLVKLHWGAKFEKTGDHLHEFDVSYVVQKTGSEPRILMFVSHQDEEQAMHELGLVPEEHPA
jgi:hypothetical protein